MHLYSQFGWSVRGSFEGKVKHEQCQCISRPMCHSPPHPSPPEMLFFKGTFKHHNRALGIAPNE